MPERVTSLRQIKKVLTHPEVFKHVDQYFTEESYLPNMSCIYYRLGDGLLIYEPYDDAVDMHGAIIGGVKREYVQNTREQWKELKSMGFNRITTNHPSDHKAASFMCAMLGMELIRSDERKYYEVHL